MKVFNKKVATATSIVGVVCAGSIAAYAYFTAGGSATGATAVGSSTGLTVTGAAGTGNPSSTGTMYPGTGTSTLTYRITNPATNNQAVSSVVVTLATSGSDIVDDSTGTAVSGCLASWFAVASPTFKASDGTTTVALPADLATTDYITGTTAVTMTNPAVTQDACQGHAPRVTVTVS